MSAIGVPVRATEPLEGRLHAEAVLPALGDAYLGIVVGGGRTVGTGNVTNAGL